MKSVPERVHGAIHRAQDPRRLAQAKQARTAAQDVLRATPPAQPAKATRALSHLLDSVFTVPGTTFRFGIDPILSIFPAVGAAVGAIFGTVVLADAVRLRAPIPVLFRMLGNHVINWLLGTLPVVGPFLDAWWKSNNRNVKLLNRSIADREQVRHATIQYWIAVGVILAVALGIVIIGPILLLLLLDSWVTKP